MTQNLSSNIWKYTIASVANKRIFVAILGAYYLTIDGVTPQVIGTIALCGSIASFLFEIPSGYISDKVGHKQALIISRIAMLLSSICFFLAEHTVWLILATVIMGAGAAFNSGTGSAFMHETLKGLNRENEYSTIMGRISSIGFAVPIFLTVSVPFLVSISYKIPFLLMGIIDIIGLIAVLNLVTPPVTPEHIEEVQASNLKQVIQEGYRLSYFTIAVFSGIISATLLSVSVFRAAYQVQLGVPVIWFGILVGIGRGLASLMLSFGQRFEKYFTLTSFFRFQYVLQVLLIIGVGFFENTNVILGLFILISSFHWGLSKIDEGYQLQVIKTSKFKATLLSVGAQIESTMTAGIGFLLGWTIQKTSYASGFLYLGIFVGVVLTILYVRMNRVYRGVR